VRLVDIMIITVLNRIGTVPAVSTFQGCLTLGSVRKVQSILLALFPVGITINEARHGLSSHSLILLVEQRPMHLVQGFPAEKVLLPLAVFLVPTFIPTPLTSFGMAFLIVCVRNEFYQIINNCSVVTNVE